MEILRTVLTVLFVIDCIGLSVIILMQEGKSQGLGSIAGMADTYWGKNKGRSMEGAFGKSNQDNGCFIFCAGIGIKSELLIMTLLLCKGVIFLINESQEKEKL